MKYLPHFISFRGVFQRFACQFVRNFVYLPAKERKNQRWKDMELMLIRKSGSENRPLTHTWVEYTNGNVSNKYNGSLLPGTTEFEESSYWEKTDISFK